MAYSKRTTTEDAEVTEKFATNSSKEIRPKKKQRLLENEEHNLRKTIPIANVTSPFSPVLSPTITHEQRKDFSIEKQPISAKPPNNRKRGNSMSFTGNFSSFFLLFLTRKTCFLEKIGVSCFTNILELTN